MNRMLIGLLMFFVVGFSSCNYQRIYEREVIHTTARIPVKINWAKSGFEIQSDGSPTKQGDGSVHRATIRLFPTDGSEPIELYLEGNVFEGVIDIPVGEYSVIAMNESIYDSYWQGSESGGFQSVVFESVNSYEDFSARVRNSNTNPTGYFFTEYQSEDYQFIQPPLRLASWSLDTIIVTQEMADYSQGVVGAKLEGVDKEMFYALTRDNLTDEDGIDMRAMTYNVSVGLRVKNLSSVSTIRGAVLGFVDRANMRTAMGYRETATKTMVQYFTFNGRKNWYDADDQYMGDGWQPEIGDNIYEDFTGETTASFLSFGRDLDLGTSEQYDLDLDIIYLSGEIVDENIVYSIDDDRDLSTPNIQTMVPIDVTKQVVNSNLDIGLYSLNIDLFISTLELEYTEGDITVSDWGDEVIVPLG